MNQYNGRLQSIQESDQEYQDHQSVQNRLSISNQCSYNFENSSISKILMSKNLNSIQLPSSLYLKNQQQDNQALYKYNSKPQLQQSQAVIASQHQITPYLQTQSQKYTLPNTIEDLLTVQNGGTSKHFFDENSIDLSFINFLNKDDHQNAQQISSNISKAAYTNRQLPNYASVFQSNGQLSSIQNLNTSNNLTQYPSAILGSGGVKASQQVQEKYQQGLQNINDLVQLLTSPSYTPDRVAQTKQQENTIVSQNNQNSQPKPISQQYDEIMLKYQSVLQNSQSDKINENYQDNQRSPFNNQNESIKINDVSECLYPISDSYSNSNIGPFNPQQDPNNLGQKANHRRLSSLDYQQGSNENNQNRIVDRKRLSPSSRQFTFEQNNDMRSSSLSLNRFNNQSINTNQINENQIFSNNQQLNANSLNSNNNNNVNSQIAQNSNNYYEEATKKAQNQKQQQQQQNPLNSVNLNDVQQNYVNSYQNQIAQQGTTNTNSNMPYMSQNQSVNNKIDYSNSQAVQGNAAPSLKSQQYEQILQKYLPKGYATQNSTQQNIYSSQNSQNNSASSSMIANGGMNNDAKGLRDRSNSINKLATARELLENFSATKKNNSNQNSPQPRQPLGIIQNNLANSLASEKFNTLSSAQKMKESNFFLQNNTLKESNVFQQNQMKDSNGFQNLQQFKDSKGFQNQSNYQNTYNSKSLTLTQQQMTQQNTLQDDVSGIPLYKPLYNTTLTNEINPLHNQNYNNIISNLPDLKVQPYFQNQQISVNENISQLQNKRASFDYKQPISQSQQPQTNQGVQKTTSDYTNQAKYNLQYSVSPFIVQDANKNNQIEQNNLQTQISYNKNIDNISATPILNAQEQFVRTNNHMKSVNEVLPQQITLPNNSNQVTRRQSIQSESRFTSQQYDLSSQRKNSIDKPVILDAKSLLLQKEQEIKMQTTQQQNGFYNLQSQQQQPLQQLSQQPYQQQTVQPLLQQPLLQPIQQQQQYVQQSQYSQSFYNQQQQQSLQSQPNSSIQQQPNLLSALPQPQVQYNQQLQQQNQPFTNQNQLLIQPQNLQQQQPQVFQQQQMIQQQGISVQQNNPQAFYQQQILQPQGVIQQQQAVPHSMYQDNQYQNYQTINQQNQPQHSHQPFDAKLTHVDYVFNTQQSSQKPTQYQRSNSFQSQQQSSATQSNKFQSQPFDKLTINTQFNKEIVIPSTISPISTPTNGRNKQNNVDKEFELEFKDFVLDLQTQQQTHQDQGEKRTLKPSHSQPFLTNAFFSAQKEQVSNNLNNNDYMVKSQQKPKRKIFEEHFKNQNNHKTLKMNGQMLKNVLGLTKAQNRNSNNLSDNQYSLRANTENNLSGNTQEAQYAKDMASNNNPNINFSRQTMHNILNPYRQPSQTSYLPPKPKYIVPPKEESPIKNYYNNASIQNQNQEPEKLRTSQNLDSKDQYSSSKMQEFNIFSNKQSIATTSAFRFTNKNEGTNYRPSETPNQFDKSYQTGTLQTSFKQKEEAKDMIRTIKSDEQLEENVKRAQFSRSKSTAKIFANQNEDNKNVSQGVQITFQNPLAAQNSNNAVDIDRNSEFKKQSAASIYKPQQTQYNFMYPQITDKDRKMLQMAEQKMQNQNQDQSVLGIPILCINCDNYYEQKEIENHICIPKESNQPKQEVKQELANPYSQKSTPEQQFSVENSLVNDKIKVIYDKISEQPQSNEQDQIKQLIERILKLNLNSEGLTKECRTLSHLNKTVENIKSRAGLSLLILSQRAEVLLKDKIDIYRRKEGLSKNQNASNVFNINHINQMNVLEFNKSSYSSSRANAFVSNQNIESQKANKNEELPTEYDVTEINFTQNNKTDRIESNRNTANNNYEKVNSANAVPTNNSPRISLNINQNQVSIQKNRIFSPPVTKIFNHSINSNFGEPQNKIQNYNEKIEIESTTNYSKKKQGINSNQNDDAQSQYNSSQMSIESKDLLKKYQQSSSLIKFNESSVQSQQKRQFYNIALNLKLKLPANHPARDCVISEMFTQAEKQNVPENNYQKYIENYFKQFKN
ncbi:hypothetical protein TTHERM_00509060 (macronuclear) [Tetrahymena thermophila SB210]|uniref:Uncharacterized protein n=1 Tax=Tetrahymena thermophila (strain SB210) TaxID=312017 RepID=I7MIU3_TETTS|nr:hypothetical protein TTHERM_00509060 [Tetrahymena thermophila SB210]EAR94965.1 hypothetical protein TTHERM_00509060 [Tetrahymena thermophila SB210]|eukprot:XP_001015210.1 hypothetical protein TTHERM_00509060 [Tetrahymena thermophila SB210]